MSLAIARSEKSERKLSTQMRAVLLIFGADKFLMESVAPFINFDTETISWDQINKIPFGSGHRAATAWAYGVWTDQPRPKSNVFDAALSMSPGLQAAVLQALALRWGL
ncbi:MAG: hypothetical protein NDI61_13440 [Bdellovibrionaceae bacterium]|nr:hypothetical protein [Pseudobdellovibrionaceae bacterium]